MTAKIKAEIESLGLSSGDRLKVRWSRNTGELSYGPDFPDRFKWRDEFVILFRPEDEKEGLHIFVRPGSKIKIHHLASERKK